MAHTNCARERRGNSLLPIRKISYNVLQAVWPDDTQLLGKSISSNLTVDLFYLYACLFHFFLFNIMDSVVCSTNGVHRPKYALKFYCCLGSSKMIIKE